MESMAPCPPSSRGSTIQLPNTCPENHRRYYTHIRLVTEVSPDAWNGAGFDGRLFPPGSRVAPEDLGACPVLLEYAGPQGTWRQRRQRENLWILWRYDQDLKEWREIARALSFDWHWALILREPAIRALQRSEEHTSELQSLRHLVC